jgi:hypothetical protein
MLRLMDDAAAGWEHAPRRPDPEDRTEPQP